MNFIRCRSLAAWHIVFILSVSNVWDTGTLSLPLGLTRVVIMKITITPISAGLDQREVERSRLPSRLKKLTGRVKVKN